jgi:hypothetical protein
MHDPASSTRDNHPKLQGASRLSHNPSAIFATRVRRKKLYAQSTQGSCNCQRRVGRVGFVRPRPWHDTFSVSGCVDKTQRIWRSLHGCNAYTAKSGTLAEKKVKEMLERWVQDSRHALHGQHDCCRRRTRLHASAHLTSQERGLARDVGHLSRMKPMSEQRENR